MLAASPDELVAVMATLLGDEDRAVLTGAFAEFMLESDAHGLEPGVDGWLDDDLAFLQPWGFDLGAIDRPTLLAARRGRPVRAGVARAVARRADPRRRGADRRRRRPPDARRAPHARGERLAARAQLTGAVNAGLRKGILAAADSPRVQRLVRRHGMRLGAGRFVAGETLDECIAVLRRLNEQGLYANTTLLGEGVLEPTRDRGRRRRVSHDHRPHRRRAAARERRAEAHAPRPRHRRGARVRQPARSRRARHRA